MRVWGRTLCKCHIRYAHQRHRRHKGSYRQNQKYAPHLVRYLLLLFVLVSPFLVAVVVANPVLFSGPIILFPRAGYFGKRWNSHRSQHCRHKCSYRNNRKDTPHTKRHLILLLLLSLAPPLMSRYYPTHYPYLGVVGMGHSYYSYQGHCPGLPGSGGKSLRLELRAKLPLFTLLPVRGLLGNSYPRSCMGWRERGYRSSSKALWGRTSTTTYSGPE